MDEMALLLPFEGGGGGGVSSTDEVVKSIPDVYVYGFLLSSSPHDSVSRMVAERWLDLHHLTGDNFVLVVFHPPDQLAERFRAYWRKRLGPSFGKAWKEWKGLRGEGLAYDYLDYFKPKLKHSQLPCLILFTDPEERRAVVRPIPDWDVDSLYQFVVGIAETVHESYESPLAERLEFLRKRLTSPTARTRAYLGHVKSKAVDYMKKNPAKVAVTTASLLLSLSTANVLPLAPAFIAVLSEVKSKPKG